MKWPLFWVKWTHRLLQQPQGKCLKMHCLNKEIDTFFVLTTSSSVNSVPPMTRAQAEVYQTKQLEQDAQMTRILDAMPSVPKTSPMTIEQRNALAQHHRKATNKK